MFCRRALRGPNPFAASFAVSVRITGAPNVLFLIKVSLWNW
jgi:hypothetical protein